MNSTRILQAAVGAVFLTAGALKSLDPVAAVLAVGAYDLVPPPLALAAGLLLPGLEVAIGAALLTRFLATGASALAALLSLGFLVFVVSAWSRGLDVACGCFGPLSPALEARWQTALLDAGLAVASLAAWRRARRSGLPADSR